MPADEVTFDECCRMILEDWIYRQEGATSEWRDYFRQRLEFLCQEFGITWKDGVLGGDMRGVALIARSMPASYPRSSGPMENALEYGYKPGEPEVHDRHLNAIASLAEALKHRWVALFRDLLLLRWPEAAQRTTSWSRLRKLGLGEAPDTTVY